MYKTLVLAVVLSGAALTFIGNLSAAPAPAVSIPLWVGGHRGAVAPLLGRESISEAARV
jgi:hypothetical protein